MRSLRPCGDSSATPSFPSQPEAYYGSSTYDTKAMSILIDYLVDEARQMELPIGYDLEEIEDIKNSWAGDAQAK